MGELLLTAELKFSKILRAMKMFQPCSFYQFHTSFTSIGTNKAGIFLR